MFTIIVAIIIGSVAPVAPEATASMVAETPAVMITQTADIAGGDWK